MIWGCFAEFGESTLNHFISDFGDGTLGFRGRYTQSLNLRPVGGSARGSIAALLRRGCYLPVFRHPGGRGRVFGREAPRCLAGLRLEMTDSPEPKTPVTPTRSAGPAMGTGRGARSGAIDRPLPPFRWSSGRPLRYTSVPGRSGSLRAGPRPSPRWTGADRPAATAAAPDRGG